MLVQCLDHVSGAQMNPTVSLAAALVRRMSVKRAAAECASQLAGATLGAAALQLLSPASVAGCVTRPASNVSCYQAVVIELVAGGCLGLANLAAWDARNRHLIDSWPLRIGTTVAALSFAAGEFTGASMNPVRSFGPALLSGDWDHHWVYWAGPLSGAACAAALYSLAWRAPRDLTPPASPHAARKAPPSP